MTVNDEQLKHYTNKELMCKIINELSDEHNIADYFVRVDLETEITNKLLEHIKELEHQLKQNKDDRN